MIHDVCLGSGHRWDEWCPRPDQARDLEPGFAYERRCQILGYDAVEQAEDLAAAGASRVLDTGASEAAVKSVTETVGEEHAGQRARSG